MHHRSAPPTSTPTSTSAPTHISTTAVLVAAGLAVLVTGVVLLGGVAAVVADGSAGPASRGAPGRVVSAQRLVADRPEVRAAALLRSWDARREDAWAAGDETALVSLYAAGSAAGRADRLALRRWTERGLRLHGVSAQLVGLRVVDHGPGRWEVVVVDRLRVARVVDDDGAARALPRDRPQATRVVLVDEPGSGWVVDTVTPVGPAEAAGLVEVSGVSGARSSAPR